MSVREADVGALPELCATLADAFTTSGGFFAVELEHYVFRRGA